MAEGVGLAVGIVSLAGLFTNAVQCFEYVQLGRQFGKNFQTSQLKLDNSRLRLSRWGESLGLGSITENGTLQEHIDTAADVGQAEAVLGQIIDLFADAEGISVRYKSRTPSHSGALEVFDSQVDLQPSAATLHEKMRQLSIARQAKTSLRQKAKWAIYEEKQFKRLIEDVTDLVNDLLELFPATKATQRTLCDAEVSSIGANESIAMLKEIAAQQDKLLADALAKVGDGAQVHYVTFSGANNSGFQLGHNSGSISGFTFGKGGQFDPLKQSSDTV